MKRLLVILMFVAVLTLSIPGLAQAEGNQPKQDFIDNYINTLSQSVQIQNSMYQACKTNTFTLTAKGTLTDSLVVMKNGMRITNVPGDFNLVFSFNLPAERGSCKFDLKAVFEEYKGEVYVSSQGLVVTRETLEALGSLDGYYPEELEDAPAYIVIPIDAEDWQSFIKTFNEGLDSSSKQTQAVIEIMKDLFNIIPDSCYSYEGNKPVLKLDLGTFASKEFLANLKAGSSSLADKVVTIVDNTAPANDDSYKVTKQDIVDDIKDLNQEDITKVLKECPIKIKECKITSYPGGLDQSYDFEFSDSYIATGITMQSQTAMGSASASSKINGQINVKDPDNNIRVNFTGLDNQDHNRTTDAYDLSLQADTEEATITGKAKLSFGMDWSTKDTIYIPTLTPQNSKSIKELEPAMEDDYYDYSRPDDGSIGVNIDGEDIDFGHVKPIITDGHTMVPLRELTEYMGGDVEWQPSGKIVLDYYDDDPLTISIGSAKYVEDGKEMTMDVAPTSVDGHTYVPITFIADYFCYEVEWDGELNTVFLYSY